MFPTHDPSDHRPSGWSLIDGLWVCGTCGYPTKEWLLAEGDKLLNLFRGGPMDGQAYETSQLLSTSALSLPVVTYRWTPEIVTSEKTGRRARVWVHKGDAAPALPEVTPVASTQHQQEDHEMAAKKKTVLERRNALKLGREGLAAEAGISASQLWRLENDKPIKDGTAAAVEEALTRVEAATAEAAKSAEAITPPAIAEPEAAANPS